MDRHMWIVAFIISAMCFGAGALGAWLGVNL